MNPEANTAGHTSHSHIPAGADPTHIYHHHEDHQQGFHTPPPYRTMPYGFSPPNNVHGYQDVGNNMSSLLESVNSTLTSIQKQLVTLEEKHAKTKLTLSEIQSSSNEIKEMKATQKSTSRKSPPGLSVCNYIYFVYIILVWCLGFRPVCIKYMHPLMKKTSIGILRGTYTWYIKIM